MKHPFYSWACPTLLGDNGKVDKPGCGGNWGPRLPERCPRCGGALRLTGIGHVVNLYDDPPPPGGVREPRRPTPNAPVLDAVVGKR